MFMKSGGFRMRSYVWGLIILVFFSGCLSNLVDFKSPGELTVRLQEEEALVAELEGQIAPKDEKIEDLSDELNESNEEVKSLNQNITGLETSLNNLEFKLSEEQLSNAKFIGITKDFFELSEELSFYRATLDEIIEEWIYLDGINEQKPNYTIDLDPWAEKYINISGRSLETMDAYEAYINKSDNRAIIESLGVNVTQELSSVSREKDQIDINTVLFSNYLSGPAQNVSNNTIE